MQKVPARHTIAIAIATMLASLAYRAQAQSSGSFLLQSSAFTNGGSIPATFTCKGKNISPPLSWSGAPPDAKSLALIVQDPDAPVPDEPGQFWTHWVIYNLPPQMTGLPRGANTAPNGALDGLNDWKKSGYDGPCPPHGRHRYLFTLYALDAALPDMAMPTEAQLQSSMTGHMLARTQLLGTYAK